MSLLLVEQSTDGLNGTARGVADGHQRVADRVRSGLCRLAHVRPILEQ
jgi:hypothetical protein